MNYDSVRKIADAVLYEGYVLYPYRPSSVKNRQRWTFGGLYPEPYAKRISGASEFQAQMLVESVYQPDVSVTVRFLQLAERPDGLEEGIPREVGLGPFEFAGSGRQHPLHGSVTLSCEPLSPGIWRLTLRVENLSSEDHALAVLASTHAIVRVAGGSFVSLTDPPEALREEAASCANSGVWPVLAGDSATRDCMLVSPIILYDYPHIAAESAGDLFDGTEIDEILTLRIMTLTDQEKEEIRTSDPRARDVLERSDSLSTEQLMKLHGVLRSPRALEDEPVPQIARVFGVDLKQGDRVRLRPKKQADIMDIALAGKIAQIESIQVDYEERVHLAVVVEDDPGKDLGVLKQPGHRFFFSADEVEPLSEAKR